MVVDAIATNIIWLNIRNLHYSTKEKRQNKEIARFLKIDLNNEHDKQNEILSRRRFGRFDREIGWLKRLRGLKDLLEDKNRLLLEIEARKLGKEYESEFEELAAKRDVTKSSYQSMRRYSSIEHLVNLGILIIEDYDEYSIDPQFKQKLDRLVDYLELTTDK